MANRKYAPEYLKAELTTWGKEPLLINLSEEDKKMVRNRIRALNMYIEQKTAKEIYETTGINRASLLRLIEKGMLICEDGKPMGYRAMFPYTRTKEFATGKIQMVMDQYEDLEQKVIDFYFSRKPGRAMKRPDKKTTHEFFMTELMKAGHDTNTYPFTLSDGGSRIFNDWLDRKEIEKSLYLERQKKEAKTEDKRTGSGARIINPARPYSVIEIDGHRLDLIYVVEIKDEEGNLQYIPVERPWLLAAIDVATRAIVSYRVVFSSEYSSIDVMKLIEGVTIPFTDKIGIRKDGMPSQVFEEARYALPELIMLDNALAHYAKDITDKTSEYGYQFCYGPVADPTKRPHIERFFGTFEKKWGHKLPSTTGSNPGDLVRIEAEKDAIRFRFTREYVNKLVDLSVATYNNTPHKGIDDMTPIGKMRWLINTGYLPNRLALTKRPSFRLWCKRKATLRGNKQTGKHVYIQKNNFVYTSDTIGRNYNLVGTKVTILMDPDNINVIHVYTENDTYLGPLYVKGHRIPDKGGITMKQGKEVHEYLRKHGLKPSFGLDDVKMFIEETEKNPETKTNLKKVENIKVSMPEIEDIQISSEENAFISDDPDSSLAQANKSEASGFFEETEQCEKNLSFDERTADERRKALRKKYERKLKGGDV